MTFAQRKKSRSRVGLAGWALALCVAAGSTGCERAWRNGFIDPTQTGRFDDKVVRTEIRRTLGALEEPEGLPGASEPTREDLVARYEEPPITRGDVIDVSIFELFQPGQSTDVRRSVNEVGFLSLPVLGPMKVADITPRQFELMIIGELKRREILTEPEVNVTVVQSQARRFAVVGNVTRPGEYPLPRPDFRLLDVISAVGPIAPTQRKLYILRGGAPKPYMPPGAESLYQQGGSTPAVPTSGSPATEPTTPSGEEDPFADSAAGATSLSDFSTERSGPSSPSDRMLADANRSLEVIELQTAGRPAGMPAPSAPASMDENLAAPSRSAGPTHDDFLGAIDSTNKPQAKELGAGAAPTGGSKFIFRDGEWVEVTDGATMPPPGESAPPMEGVAAEPGEKPAGVDWEKLSEPETPQRIIEIAVESLTRGDTRYNVVIRPNDVVNVPNEDVGEYYVTGHIARPGAYTLTGRQITVKEAIASAGGFDLVAWPSRAELIRRLPGDQEEFRSINLDRILAGDEPDFFLKSHDIINVGTNAIAPFLATIRNSFRMSYGFGFVYDRNFADEDSFFAQEQLRARRRAERQARGFPP